MKVCFVLCVLSTVVVNVTCSGEYSRFDKSFNYSPGMIQVLRETLTDWSQEAHGYLVHLIGARSVETAQKCFFQLVKYLAAVAASGANVVMKYLTQFLRAAGVDVEMPVNSITPDAVVNIGQWLLLALIGYWLLSLAFRLVASTLRRVLWLLKLGVVLGLFGLILSDHSAGTETTALRLAGLVSVCVLLGIGHSGTGGDKTDLEDQVRVLERQVREMERRRRSE